MSGIQRLGDSHRWSDVVIHAGVARWVEVAADRSQETRGQIRQVLDQITETLGQVGSSPQHLLQIVIYLADLSDISVLNELWDAWIHPGHAPIRACVQAGMTDQCRVEMIITAAVI